jgi:hypothetical protein
VKIKELLEVFGTKRVRDPSGTGYERDPETGEYTGRQENDPNSFTNMLSGVADRISAGSGSQWVNAPAKDKEPAPMKRYKVPPGRMLIATTKDGRQYFKLAAKPNSKDKSGIWKDINGNEIFDAKSIDALEQLAKQNGQLTFDPAAIKAAQSQKQQGDETPTDTPDEEPYGEPSVSEPLHPDVSIVQSVPLVIQYKGKRFEMDDYGEFHPFGTTRPVTAALQTFLTKERAKL